MPEFLDRESPSLQRGEDVKRVWGFPISNRKLSVRSSIALPLQFFEQSH